MWKSCFTSVCFAINMLGFANLFISQLQTILIVIIIIIIYFRFVEIFVTVFNNACDALVIGNQLEFQI